MKKEVVFHWDTHAGGMVTHCDMAVFHCRCAFAFPFQAASQASKLTLSQEEYVAEKKAEVVCIRRETGFGVLEAPGEDYTLEGKSSRDFWEG